MNFTQALHVLRSGGSVGRQGRTLKAAKDDRGRIFGGILDVTEEEPQVYKFSDEDREAEDWADADADADAPPQVVAPEAVDEALTEHT